MALTSMLTVKGSNPLILSSPFLPLIPRLETVNNFAQLITNRQQV
jgi:hypothetical protein